MSTRDRRTLKKKKDNEYNENDKETEKPGKNEYAVAKWIRKNVQVKKTKFLNHNVEYFSSSKALDALMESKFATGDNSLFATRQHAIDYLDLMLTHKFFHRARKVTVSEHELKSKSKPKEVEKDDDAENEPAAQQVETKKGAAAAEKKKRKIRLEMHPQQIFRDGHEAYVWIYDPIPFYYWVFGTLVVLGAIVICLFPLWPPQLRTGVYYLSMTAAGFLVFLLVLVILRFILFCCVWIASGGKHHFWFLPNLTEDVGFFDSFKPLYKHENVSDPSKKSKKDKKKKKKCSDDEDNDDNENGEKNLIDTASNNEANADDLEKRDEKNANKNSESESSDSQKVGRDFEMVEAEEDEDDEE